MGNIVLFVLALQVMDSHAWLSNTYNEFPFFNSACTVMATSWYGPRFHKHLTSSKEVYNQYAFTAAHKELPFNTRLLLFNPETGLRWIARINDRGPYIKGRKLDVSLATAEKLRMKERGVVNLWVCVLESEGDLS
jgi:rare lipoprotein A